jgi:hypothetical protein
VDIKVDDLSPAKVTRIQVEKVRDRLLPEGSDGSVVDLSSIASIIFRSQTTLRWREGIRTCMGLLLSSGCFGLC